MTEIIIFCIFIVILVAACGFVGYQIGYNRGRRKAMSRWLKGGKG